MLVRDFAFSFSLLVKDLSNRSILDSGGNNLRISDGGKKGGRLNLVLFPKLGV